MSRHFFITCGLSLYGVVLALCFQTGDRWLCALAMILSTLGDLLLMDFRHIGRVLLGDLFTWGAGAFMLSHAVYCMAFLEILRWKGFQVASAGLWIGLGITALVIVWFIVKAGRMDALVALCMVYALCIGMDLALSCSFAWQIRSIRSLAAVGVALFFLSDVFIGLSKLLGIREYGKYVWIFYPIGQVLLLTFA